jgi:hypothetical protein
MFDLLMTRRSGHFSQSGLPVNLREVGILSLICNFFLYLGSLIDRRLPIASALNKLPLIYNCVYEDDKIYFYLFNWISAKL